ncbi:MAG TPA: hypothetical protein VNP20_00620, partial [Nocardioidaceae bacterium]|nr:hypothetical protein [Nocardioidaceae bacterium]
MTTKTPETTTELVPDTSAALTQQTPDGAARLSAAATEGMTPEMLDAFGAELDEIRQRIIADLGDEDREYIY